MNAARTKKGTKVSREELFENTPVWSAIWTLTIPVIIGSLISLVYNLVDTYFVGTLNDPIQNAAITLAAPAMTLVYGITNLFGIGASSLMSRSMGVKDYDTVRKSSATGIYGALICACTLSALTLIFNSQTLTILGADSTTWEATRSYTFWTVCLGTIPTVISIMFNIILRAEGRAMLSSIGPMLGCVINIILDPFFILPQYLNMGATGAGLATFIANVVSCLYFAVLLIVLKGKTLVSVNPRDISFKVSIFKEIFSVGFPGVMQNVLNVLSIAILNNIIATYGAVAVASVGIAVKLNQLPMQILFGFSQGVMPLIGYNYASRNHERMQSAIKKTYIIILSSMAVLLLVFNLMGAPLIRFFMDNDEIVRLGRRFLSGYGLSLPLMCFDFMTVGISQAFGKGKPALVFSIVRKAILEIPFIVLLDRLAGITGVAYAQCGSEFFMALLGIFVTRKLISDAVRRNRHQEPVNII